MVHKFDPAHIEKLLRQERYDELKPAELLTAVGLKPGGALADVGCGPGFFTIPGAEIVGEKGHVYAIDTQPAMIAALKARNLPKCVTPIVSAEDDLLLDDEAVDVALLAFVFHEVRSPIGFLRELRRILKKSGRLLLIDWKKQSEEHGPPVDERISDDQALAMAAEAGFLSVAASGLNKSHYRITATK